MHIPEKEWREWLQETIRDYPGILEGDFRHRLQYPAGAPPKGMRRRKKSETERLAMLQALLPREYRDIDPHFVANNPATRQPASERARQALAALYPHGHAGISTRSAHEQINKWLKETGGGRPVELTTVRRAMGRRRERGGK